ncbi:MAG: lipoprotein [Bauldia sp.]
MALNERRFAFRIALAGAVIAALALSACGRKGALEAPPSAATTGDPAVKSDDVGAKKPNRPFFLDGLI